MKKLLLTLMGSLFIGLGVAHSAELPTLRIAGISLGANWEDAKVEVGAQDIQCDRMSGLDMMRRPPTQGCSFIVSGAGSFVGKDVSSKMFVLLRDGVVIGLITELMLQGPAKGIEFSEWATKAAETLKLGLRRENSVALLTVSEANALGFSEEKINLSPAIYARFNPATTEVNLVIGSQEIVRYFREMTSL